MRTSSNLSVRFILANNLPTSVTRLTAEMASALVRIGIPVSVSYPAVDWLDFKLFGMRRVGLNLKWRWAFWLAVEVLRNQLFPKGWCGFSHYAADPSVRAERFFADPPLREDRNDEVLVVQHPYLIPRLLRGKPGSRKKIAAVIHNNYELEMRSPWSEAAEWKKHCVRLEISIAAVRVATSEEAREAAQRLGIPVRKVIPGGVDLSVFKPAQRNPEGSGPLTVTLYCVANPQKGQASGVEAFRGLKKSRPGDRLCSLGEVLPEAKGLFDHHYGFLHGEDYVRAIQESDIFVYPSLYDGFPAPPLQAMACGSALVTTAVEGVTGYAVDGENCLLVRPGDSQGMEAQIRRLIEDPGLRERIRANGLRTVQAFSVEETARRWLEFLEELKNQTGSDPKGSDPRKLCHAEAT